MVFSTTIEQKCIVSHFKQYTVYVNYDYET